MKERYDLENEDDKEEAKIHERSLLHCVFIDDDEQILQVFKGILNAKKYFNFVTFTDPMAATEYLSSHKVNHVFTDYQMANKDMNGASIADRCNELNIPCTIVSADEDRADIFKIDVVGDIYLLLKKIK